MQSRPSWCRQIVWNEGHVDATCWTRYRRMTHIFTLDVTPLNCHGTGWCSLTTINCQNRRFLTTNCSCEASLSFLFYSFPSGRHETIVKLKKCITYEDIERMYINTFFHTVTCKVTHHNVDRMFEMKGMLTPRVERVIEGWNRYLHWMWLLWTVMVQVDVCLQPWIVKIVVFQSRIICVKRTFHSVFD